jgi:predicted AAA+ superfamily ATPase
MSRIADKVLDDALRSSGAVLIEGPKWCGKTWTAQNKAESILYLQDPDYSSAYQKAAAVKPSLLLEGDTPRLLDEWQMIPVLWDAVRHAVDQRAQTGQFILTGSAVPADDSTLHSGTGRIARRKMRPMSLFESHESSGEVSLMELFEGKKDIATTSSLSIEALAFALARGGWPASIGETEQTALARVYDYVDAVIHTDVSRVDGVERNPSRVRSLLRSYARNISTAASITTIRNDIAADDTMLSEKTIAGYLTALERIHVIEDLRAWNPAIRSKTAIRTTATRHFVDPSIAVAALRTSPSGLLGDFETFGLLFESLCIRDLRIYASAHDGEVLHYRDKSGLEADAVVCLKDGRWGAVEVKMGAAEIDKGAEHLIGLARKVDIDKMAQPSFLMVLTATEFGYQRDDGVLVVPIGSLKD